MTHGTGARGRTALVLLATASLGAVAPAAAQQADGGSTGIDTIMVTARKRSEDLQQVPIAINTLSGEQIEARGLTSIDDVVRTTSSVIFQQGFSPQDTKITIRGLSPDRGRVNVAVLLDGVDITSESIQTVGGSLLINPELFDLERVEIVKGPQNALYGRSAYNGAISYVTRKPSETFEATVGTDVGNYGQFKLTGRASGPLIGDTLLGGITAVAYTNDGYWRNGVTGAEVGGRDGFGGAGTLTWRPVNGLSVTGRISRSDDEYQVQPWAFMNPNRQFAFPQAAINDGVTTGCSNTDAAGFAAGTWPVATTNCTEPVSVNAAKAANFDAATGQSDVGALLGQPGLLPFQVGFLPGAGGTFPSAKGLGNAGTMSEDPYSCTNPNDRTTCRDFEGYSAEVTRGTLDVQWEFADLRLTALSHLADSKVRQFQDSNDSGSVFDQPFISQGRWITDTKLFSQELRLQNAEDRRLDWTVGAQYWQEEVKQDDFGTSCLVVNHNYNTPANGTPNLTNKPNLPCGPIMANIGPNGIYPEAFEQWFRDTTHYSGYFLVDFEITETLGIALEGRYVNEAFDVGGPNGDTTVDPYGVGFNGPASALAGCVAYDPDGAGPLGPIANSCVNPRPLDYTKGRIRPGFITDEDPVCNGTTITTDCLSEAISEDRDSYFVPKATLTWRPTADLTWYASWAKAAKPSGISALTGGPGAFNPVSNKFQREERDVYELGVKTRWLDRRLTLNGALFYDDYAGKQVSTQITLPGGLITSRTVNGGDAEVFGVELEASMQFTDRLYAGIGYTYLDAEWKDYVINTRSGGTIAYGGNCTQQIVAVPSASSPTGVAPQVNCLVDLSGNKLTFAPEHSLVGNASYRRPLTDGLDGFVEGDFQFQSERYVNDTNILKLDSYWLANLRAGVSGDRWTAIAYVDNVFEDDTIKNGIDQIDIRYFSTSASVNAARGLLPDPRTYGIRLSYRFGSQ